MNDPITGEPKRPTLLTLLCVLSFFWAGILIIGGGLGYVSMKLFASGRMEEMLAQTGDPEAMKSLEEIQAKVDESGVSADELANQMVVLIVLAVISLIGVIMMWKLRRTGFFVYAACALAGIVMPLAMGGKLDTSASGIFWMGLSLVFVGLYYSQIKHMR